MEENVYLDKLERRDIKPTAIRLLILMSVLLWVDWAVMRRLKQLMS